MNVGIIGGSGLYDLEGLASVTEETVDTPFGAPSDAFVRGELGAHTVWFLPRHGRGHRLLPSEINHRANIYAFKAFGVEQIIAFNAVGSLREDVRPRDILLPDQYYDRTKQSSGHTFFGDGIVGHVAFGEPACPVLRHTIATSIRQVLSQENRDIRLFDGGTYVNMEGPAFSTRAESNAYRAWGFDVIGMNSLPEAKLCREAEICYQSICMITDYDCWHEAEEAVSATLVMGHLRANTALAKRILDALIPFLPESRECSCATALDTAVMTDPSVIPDAAMHRLAPIVKRYCEARRAGHAE